MCENNDEKEKVDHVWDKGDTLETNDVYVDQTEILKNIFLKQKNIIQNTKLINLCLASLCHGTGLGETIELLGLKRIQPFFYVFIQGSSWYS